MGCCYGGVNNFCGPGGGSGFACEMGYDPISLAWGQSPFLRKGIRPRYRIAGKKNPRRSEEFFRWCPGEDSNLHGFTR